MQRTTVNIKRALVALAVLSLPFAGQATVLFQDTFDRADNLDIDADSAGMSGTAAPITYKESDPLPTPNNEALTQVANSALYMAFGPNASLVGLESHNFIDSEILTEGGFRISMDMENLGTQTANDFFCGFGVGVSTNEMANFQLDYNSTAGLRGRMGSAYTGVADFYTCYTPNGGGDVQIFFQAVSTGTQIDVNVGNLIGTNATLRADFYPDGFGAGDNVNVYVYMNDSLVVQTNFAWTESNENHVAINARQSTGFIVDNLVVESFIPDPIVAGFSVEPVIVDAGSSSNLIVLQWNADFMSEGATYTISADKAVTYPSGNTGSALDGANVVSAVVDGTLGDVEFTLVVDSSGMSLTNAATATALPFAPALTTVLFSDSFDRVSGNATNDWNVSASQTGVGGILAASLPATNFWLETHQDGNISETNWNDACLIIASNGTEQICRMSTALASSMGLDHNFTNDVILSDGGFSVSMDVGNWNGVGDRDRYSGFGVGLSRNEVMALVDDATEGCARGSLTRAPGIMGVSDLWVGMGHVGGGSGSFQILAEGVRIDELPLSSDVGNIRIDFGVSDFNAGSFVAYKLYFDQALMGEGFFKWNNEDENYIVVSSRIDNGVDVDNVTIGTVGMPFTAPVEGERIPATVDLSGSLTNVVLTAEAQASVVSRVDQRQGYLANNPNKWQILLESPRHGNETVLDYDAGTNVTINVDTTAYGWTNGAPMGYFQIKPVGWKVPVN